MEALVDDALVDGLLVGEPARERGRRSRAHHYGGSTPPGGVPVGSTDGAFVCFGSTELTAPEIKMPPEACSRSSAEISSSVFASSFACSLVGFDMALTVRGSPALRNLRARPPATSCQARWV